MRQYVSAKPFDGAGLLEVVGKDFRYFKNVLRLRVGDMVRVCEPGGSSVNSTLCALDERAKKIVLQRCDGMDGEETGDVVDSSTGTSEDGSAVEFAAGPPPMMAWDSIRTFVSIGMNGSTARWSFEQKPRPM